MAGVVTELGLLMQFVAFTIMQLLFSSMIQTMFFSLPLVSLSSQSEKVLLRTHLNLHLNLFATVLKKHYLKKDVFLVAAAKISFDNTFALKYLLFNSSVVNCIYLPLNKYTAEFGLFVNVEK